MDKNKEKIPILENKTSRRNFIDFILGTALIAWITTLVYPVLKFLVPPEDTIIYVNSVEAGTMSEFPPGSSKIIRFGRKPVIVIRKKNGVFSALSATCTHLDCTVQFKTDTEQIWCACHNGMFDTSGKNISGPPPKPLSSYHVNLKNDKVIISLEDMA